MHAQIVPTTTGAGRSGGLALIPGFVLSLVLSLPGLLSAQPAALSGRVADPAGDPVPGATVTATPVDRPGGRRTAITDATGAYRFPDLTAGAYDVTTELPGFRTATLPRVPVLADGTARADVTLELGGVAESVTVRGERAARSLKDTAASVAVFDARALERRPGLDAGNDLLARIPNVTTSGTNNFAPAVRGVDGTGPAQGADAFLAGTRSRLNVQMDGRPASYNEVVFGDTGLWDVDQVEVFRGAQSTLQGRNAVAGTMIVRTKDPSYQREGKVRVGGGNFGMNRVAAVASGPIVEDQVAYRFAIDRKASESFVDGFTSYPRVDDPGEYRSVTLRGKLLIEPKALDGFSTLVTVNHASFTGPQTETLRQPFEEHEASYTDMPVFRPRSTSGIAETKWKLDDRLTLENTVSFTGLNVERRAQPADGNAEIDGRELVAGAARPVLAAGRIGDAPRERLRRALRLPRRAGRDDRPLRRRRVRR